MIEVSIEPNEKLKKFLSHNTETLSMYGKSTSWSRFLHFYNLKLYLLEDYVTVQRYYDKKNDNEKRYKVFVKGKLSDDMNFGEFSEKYLGPSFILIKNDFTAFKVKTEQMMMNFITLCGTFFKKGERFNFNVICRDVEDEFVSLREIKEHKQQELDELLKDVE